jgi:hypothetical protein
VSHFDNPYDQAEHDFREEERREARRQRREDEEVERWKQSRFESPEMQSPSIITDDAQDEEAIRPVLFVETTGSQPLLIEWRSIHNLAMYGQIREDVDLAQLDCGCHLDAPDCIPTGSHRILHRTYAADVVFGQQVVR